MAWCIQIFYFLSLDIGKAKQKVATEITGLCFSISINVSGFRFWRPHCFCMLVGDFVAARLSAHSCIVGPTLTKHLLFGEPISGSEER